MSESHERIEVQSLKRPSSGQEKLRTNSPVICGRIILRIVGARKVQRNEPLGRIVNFGRNNTKGKHHWVCENRDVTILAHPRFQVLCDGIALCGIFVLSPRFGTV
jgi:hypothetical protein